MTSLKPEAMEAYRTTLKHRHAREEAHKAQRFAHAKRIANEATVLLKQKFQAERVLLFGSLVHEHWFSPTSDIDLAVWGLDSLTYLTAVAQLQDLDPEFKIDLIRMERCRPELERVILQEGQLL